MKNLKKNLISVFIFSLLIIIIIAIYYLLPYQKLLIDKTTLFGVVISQVITLLGTLFYNSVSNKKTLTMTAGGYATLFSYQFLVVISSILFVLAYRNAITTYKIVFISLTGLFLITSVLVYFFGKNVSDKSNVIDDAGCFFKVLEHKTESLCSLECDETIHNQLKKLYDAVKSCDQSVCIDTDNLINNNIDDLLEQLYIKEIDNDKVLEMRKNTLRLITQRNAEVCKLKLGGV